MRRLPLSTGAVPRSASSAFSPSPPATPVRSSRRISRATASYLARTFAIRSSLTSPSACPMGHSRASALSCRSSSRYSERLVIMRYGSSVPLVTRSSISVPM